MVVWLLLVLVVARSRPGTASHLGQVSGEHFANAADSNDGEAFRAENHVGEKLQENQNAVSDNSKSDFVDSNDAAHYSKQDSNNDVESGKSHSGGLNYAQNQGTDGHNLQQQSEQKKGHHKSGFHNSYHKDESSNKSTFYDDFADSGGQSLYNNHQNSFGNQNGQEFENAHQKGTRHEHDDFRGGHYKKGGGHNARYADHNDYGKRRYVDDHRDFNKANRGEHYVDRNNHYDREEAIPVYYDHHAPHYNNYGSHGYSNDYGHGYNGYDEIPSGQHQTITIYDDPRENYEVEPLREDSRHIRLDVRPGHHRFQRYDSYYAPAGNGGVHTRSNINRLVYNYNKH